jgi:hypothetical protein
VSSRTPTGWIVAALVWAVLASAWIAFVPSSREKTGRLVLDSSGQLVSKRDKVTFISAHGAWVIVLLPIPLGLAAAPLARGGSSRVTAICGAALGGFVLLASFSIGLYYLPSALLLLVGAGLAEWQPSTERS